MPTTEAEKAEAEKAARAAQWAALVRYLAKRRKLRQAAQQEE